MIHVVRHAHAGSRRRWNGDDSLRPLSRQGHNEAAALAARLRPDVAAILSSPFLRCVQTMEPVAEAAGLTLESADWLAEGTPLERVIRELRALGPGTAVCSHGDVIGDLIGHLSARDVPLNGPIRWPKGSIWHLELQEGRIVAGRYELPAGVAAAGA